MIRVLKRYLYPPLSEMEAFIFVTAFVISAGLNFPNIIYRNHIRFFFTVLFIPIIKMNFLYEKPSKKEIKSTISIYSILLATVLFYLMYTFYEKYIISQAVYDFKFLLDLVVLCYLTLKAIFMLKIPKKLKEYVELSMQFNDRQTKNYDLLYVVLTQLVLLIFINNYSLSDMFYVLFFVPTFTQKVIINLLK